MLLQFPLTLLSRVHPEESARESNDDGAKYASDGAANDGGLALFFAAVVRNGR